MTTPAFPSHPPTGSAAPRRRTPWRALLLLTVAVVVAHLALLGSAPVAVGPDPSPLAPSFMTRTIVVPPPAPPQVAPLTEPAPPTAPKPKPIPAPAKRVEPKPAAPKPAPQPEPDTARAPLEPTRPAAAETTPAQPLPTEPAAESASAADATPPLPGATAGVEPASTATAPSPPAAPAAPASGQALAPAAVLIPGPVRLKFTVTAQQGTVPLQGAYGELTWLQDGRTYDARLSLRFLFKTLRMQHSSGTIGPDGIQPDRFSDTRKTEIASHFVRDQGQVVFSNNAPSVPLIEGAQDRLSVMLQLGALLAGDPARYPADGAIAVQTVGPRDADIWLFKVGAEEKLSLPAGEFVARKLTRNPRKPFDDTVELWLAPALGYLPVRIKLTQPDGDFADMQLREQLTP